MPRNVNHTIPAVPTRGGFTHHHLVGKAFGLIRALSYARVAVLRNRSRPEHVKRGGREARVWSFVDSVLGFGSSVPRRAHLFSKLKGVNRCCYVTEDAGIILVSRTSENLAVYRLPILTLVPIIAFSLSGSHLAKRCLIRKYQYNM